jgi:xylan 1,4-beta-xylosidase
MKSNDYRVIGLFTLLSLNVLFVLGQKGSDDSSVYYNQVKTYVHPVLPGDHRNPTLLKVGDDFYHCGSSFHFTPYLPVLHPKDLVHWQIISRVVPPSKAGFVTEIDLLRQAWSPICVQRCFKR